MAQIQQRKGKTQMKEEIQTNLSTIMMQYHRNIQHVGLKVNHPYRSGHRSVVTSKTTFSRYTILWYLIYDITIYVYKIL